MSENRRFVSGLRTHAYLWRLLICLCVLCVCTAAAVLLFGADNLQEQIDHQLLDMHQSAGNALAGALDGYAAQLEMTAMQASALSGEALSAYLRGVEYSLNAVTRMCVYDQENQTLIGSAGTEPFELFIHTFFPALTVERFKEMLSADPPFSFAESSNGMIAFPVRTGKYVVFYVLNSAVMKESADAMLPPPFELLVISDIQGRQMLSFADEAASIGIFPAEYARLSIGITQPSARTSAVAVVWNDKSVLIVLLSCTALIALLALILYCPVQKVRTLIPDAHREELCGLDEFAAIATSIADGERLQEEMKQEALEQHSITISRLYEKLLYGIRIPPEKLSALPLALDKEFRVAVASLDQVENVNAIKSGLADYRQIYVLELYDTAHLAFICTGTEQDGVMQDIHCELGVPIGVGNACRDLTGLHRSYIEAVSALSTGSGLVRFSDDASRSHPEEDPQISALADALLTFMQSDRERAMTLVDEIFDLLDTKEDSLLFRQHAYVRFVMPFFDRVRETYPDAHFSIEPITNATHWGSVSLKERFCQALTEAMDSLPARKPLEQDGLLFFVEEHLFDPYFGLGDIAQKYNITEYTASRLFKEVGGVSFKKYVTNRRIERAKYLLTSSELKMSEIAQQCGFASASYFARIFRNAEELSPAEYRQQAQMTKPQ